jgi:hypothetical protein
MKLGTNVLSVSVVCAISILFNSILNYSMPNSRKLQLQELPPTPLL